MSKIDFGRPGWAYLGLVLTTLFWAGNAVVARATAGEVPPFALSFWRWVLALLVVLPFGLPHVLAAGEVIRRHWRRLFGLAALSVGAYNTLLYLAAQTTSAVNITLVNSTIPVVIALLAWLLMGARVTRWQLLGIAAALAGMLAIISRGEPAVLVGMEFHPGDLIMVAAVIIWGLYSVLIGKYRLPLHPLGLLTVLILGGLPLILPFYLWELSQRGGFQLTARLMPAFGYLGLFPSVLAYLFWNHGIKVIGPSRAGIFIYLMPVFAAGLASVFLGERLQGFHALGGLLILIGLYLATRMGPREG